MTEEKLIQKILNDAKKQANALLDSALASSEQKVTAAEIAAKERKEKAIALAKKNFTRMAEQTKLAQEVENIKSEINSKQAAMAEVFNAVYDKIKNAKPAEKKTLVDALTKKYAKTGDKITPTEDGGIFISNKNYDLDLSLNVLTADLREEIEPRVAGILFG